MKRLGILVVLTGFLMVAVNVAEADWNPGDPYKMHFPQLPDPQGWDVNATFPKILADDFLCTETGLITDVHFWGSWFGDFIGEITNVHLSLHANILAPPEGFSMPGEELWHWDGLPTAIVSQDPSPQGWFDPNTGQWEHPNHVQWFQYNIDIDEAEAFEQQVGEIYWLDIQIQVLDPITHWGWKTSLEHWEDDAVWGDFDDGDPDGIVWNELIDPATGESLDLAFVITPEPATIVLLGLGVAGTLAARKKR